MIIVPESGMRVKVDGVYLEGVSLINTKKKYVILLVVEDDESFYSYEEYKCLELDSTDISRFKSSFRRVGAVWRRKLQ